MVTLQWASVERLRGDSAVRRLRWEEGNHEWTRMDTKKNKQF